MLVFLSIIELKNAWWNIEKQCIVVLEISQFSLTKINIYTRMHKDNEVTFDGENTFSLMLNEGVKI